MEIVKEQGRAIQITSAISKTMWPNPLPAESTVSRYSCVGVLGELTRSSLS
ncbi:hypothetical protein HanPSC8_Chr10g0425901 [Helianthus annuus]|nr:hypothetical protein HanPSC8_Chr10g0425901 [Helianthus annuus]